MTPPDRAALVALLAGWIAEADRAGDVAGDMVILPLPILRRLHAALAAATAGEPVGEPTPREACTTYTPDHNGECLLCDEPADAHDAPPPPR